MGILKGRIWGSIWEVVIEDKFGWGMMEYKRIFRDGSNLLAGRVGTVIIGLVNFVILTRLLTTEDMGKYSLFLMVVNLALTLGVRWSDTSIVRHGREEFMESKKINQSFWARFYIFSTLLLTFTLLFTIFSKQLALYIGIERKLIILVILMFIFHGLLNYIIFVYQSIDQMRRAAYILLSQKLFYLFGLFLIFFGLIRVELGIVLIVLNLSLLISLIVNLKGLNFGIFIPYRFSKRYFRKIWSFSWPQLVGFSGLYIINYIDLFVIKKYMTLEAVGIYSVAYKGFEVIGGAMLAVNILFLPLIIEYKVNGKYELISSYLKKTPLIIAGWSLFVLIGIFLSQYIIPFTFSIKYISSIPSFNILLASSIFFLASICLMPVINAFDLVLFLQLGNIISSLMNVIADFILVPKIGIIGAAYGTLFSFAMGFLLSAILVFFKRNAILGRHHGVHISGLSKK